jgi:hypothetical protein
VPAAKPVYGVLSTDAVQRERSEETRTIIALSVLVAGLAAATIWFVALPLLSTPSSSVPEACTAFVLTDSGVLRCVPETTFGSPAAATGG